MTLTPQQVKDLGYDPTDPGAVLRKAIPANSKGDSGHFDGSGDIKTPKKRLRQSGKPLLNELEKSWRNVLIASGHKVLEQAITLRLDPPFKRYRPDLAYQLHGTLVLVECKGHHRFREKGIARVALAAKTYPMFRFELVERNGVDWKISAMTP